MTDKKPDNIEDRAVQFLHNENAALRLAAEHTRAETRTLRLWLRQDAAEIARWQDCSEQLAAVLQTFDSENAAIKFYKTLKNNEI